MTEHRQDRPDTAQISYNYKPKKMIDFEFCFKLMQKYHSTVKYITCNTTGRV